MIFHSKITDLKKTYSNQAVGSLPGNQPAKICLTVN